MADLNRERTDTTWGGVCPIPACATVLEPSFGKGDARVALRTHVVDEHLRADVDIDVFIREYERTEAITYHAVSMVPVGRR